MKKYFYDETEQTITIGSEIQEDFKPAFIIKNDKCINGFKLESNFLIFDEMKNHEAVIEWLGNQDNVLNITMKKFCKALEKQLNYQKLA